MTDGARRVEAFSYFFPAHDEEANIRELVAEALEALPALADRFEIIAVDDGSTDATPAIADQLAAEHPDIVRAVHHPTNLGYGAALRSGFAASRYPVVGFTDGDRQFRIADLGRLLAVFEPPVVEPPTGPSGQPWSGRGPDAVVGYRMRRADPLVRLVYARLYRLALVTFFGLRVRDVDCACKIFRRDALGGVRLESGGAFLSAEMLIKFRATGGGPGGGGRAALPPDRRQGDGREPARRVARGAGLLAPAAPALGQPSRGPAARCSRGERERLNGEGRSPRSPAAATRRADPSGAIARFVPPAHRSRVCRRGRCRGS